jgi:outer membrane protein
MVSRHGLLIGLGFALASAPAIAQVPQSTPATATPSSQPPAQAAPARRVTATQVTPAQRKPPPNTPAPVTTDPGVPHTLAEALAATYSTQPQLLAERAKLRATDENVPQALAGWRPTVVMAGTAGYGDGFDRAFSTTRGAFVNAQTDRLIGTAQATLSQPIYTGGKTSANVNRATNQVMAERATLLSQEQTSFGNVVNAYVGVIEAQQLLALNINNEHVDGLAAPLAYHRQVRLPHVRADKLDLSGQFLADQGKQLQATNDRFRVGEITRTDVAQRRTARSSPPSAPGRSIADACTAVRSGRPASGICGPLHIGSHRRRSPRSGPVADARCPMAEAQLAVPSGEALPTQTRYVAAATAAAHLTL